MSEIISISARPYLERELVSDVYYNYGGGICNSGRNNSRLLPVRKAPAGEESRTKVTSAIPHRELASVKGGLAASFASGGGSVSSGIYCALGCPSIADMKLP